MFAIAINYGFSVKGVRHTPYQEMGNVGYIEGNSGNDEK